MAASVSLFGYWASPFTLRIKWALKLKGIQYEYIEEDLPNKSPLLLQYNPVHKKIPVLVHEGKPLAESLVIMEYIDEVWKESPLLPQDPYGRAKARFWSNFADDKCVPSVMRTFVAEGEDKEKAAEEAREHLKTLESGLEGKQLFGGEKINFVDVAVGWIGIWARIVEKIADVNLIDAKTMPLLDAWFAKFLELPTIKECVPPWDKLLEHNRGFRNILTYAAT
ncbi:hypothetical protein P3X46_021257 [Hevea brasiliensis]|uniref:glutathione transferase n=1 Tax=Hevea brasiliensis TaxID=3981 RepID=A0ABQ9LEX4_HEVBR|nr:glutathione transferase GST 23 [Hevea brasiliensis]KAJ9166517.1 hypothetical protein P3X46_021257 [Hevea brasiliensis]